jgi:phenylpropionate dioxygenase-like ring-hydroxylating dioxygenase large terminal subunit
MEDRTQFVRNVIPEEFAAPASQPADERPVRELEPDALMLRGFWYPAVRTAGLKRGQMRRAMLHGIPLVAGRDADGQVFALRDNCPHRGMPLSYGRFDGRNVECSYHGWQFDCHSGQCAAIPSLTNDSKLRVDRVFAGAFPAEERDGYLWVYMDDEQRLREAPPAPELPKFGDAYRMTHLECELPSNVDHGIIGLMDPAHGPFVHQSWWWRSRTSIREKEKHFEPIPLGFRMSAHQPSANSAPYKLLRVYGEPITTTIDFVLPNMRFEQIRCGKWWFSSRATVTPVEANRCRIDFVAAWNLFRWVPFITTIFRAFAVRFLRQDQETMIQQAEGLKHAPRLMLIDDADRPAKWYFALKAAYLESRRTGGPFDHPLKGPFTLRWRS